jgi:hypothetical protein
MSPHRELLRYHFIAIAIETRYSCMKRNQLKGDRRQGSRVQMPCPFDPDPDPDPYPEFDSECQL